MQKFFQVISNVNHNGTLIEKGRFIEGELSEFAHLVAMGVMKVIEGATSVESAMEMAVPSGEKAAASDAAPAKPNTWQPKPDAEAQAEKADDEIKEGDVKFEGAPGNQTEGGTGTGTGIGSPESKPGQVGTGDQPNGDNL